MKHFSLSICILCFLKVAELNRRVVAVNAARELLFREEPFSLIGFKELLRGVVDRLHDLDDELMRPVA